MILLNTNKFSKYISFSVVCFLVSAFTFAQDHKLKYAEKLFETLQYKEASEAYEKAFQKGVESQLLFEHLGDSYYYNTDMRNAHKWYAKLFKNYKDSTDPEYYFRYAHSLQGIGKNDEAKKWMKDFSRNTEFDDIRKKNYIQAAKKLDAILKIDSNYKIYNVTTNSQYSDFGASYYGDNVIFASANSQLKNPKKYYWNEQPYLNLFKGFTTDNYSDIEDAILFSKDLNTQYHESNAVFTKDLSKVFFTRNNYKKRLKDDGKGVNHLKLYSANLDKDSKVTKWKNIQELPFNSDTYSVGHPALNATETKLYFTSDMPGSVGGTDIFVVDILGENNYSAPKNLGNKINTSGREMFPFVMNDMLYFASDGHLGFGGLDVFKSNRVNDAFQYPTNIGQPINSKMDDFAFVFSEEKQSGFLSSNRKGGKGDDDIYAVIPFEKPTCDQKIAGTVTNLGSGERIANAKLELFDEVGSKLGETTSNDQGKYSFDKVLDCNSRYEVKVFKKGYKSVMKPSLTEAVTGTTYLPLAIETLDQLIVEEKGILKLKIGIIYFDLDKDFIRNDASIELNKIVLVMSQYPQMHIKIESHTDSRMPVEYNRDLSDRRAKNTREYLISKGINADRLESAEGFGESQLINRCTDGVPCSEAEHQLNRRSEFIITKI